MNRAEKSSVRIEKTCEFCNKIYFVFPYQINISKYCSYSCRSKSVPQAKNRVDKVCEYCGKIFEVIKSRENKSHFCSASCRSKKNIGIGVLSRFWTGGNKPKTCQGCGKIFIDKWQNPTKYCSHRCYTEHSMGEDSHMWRGGSKNYPAEFNRQFKEAIRERDNYTCAICSKYGKEVHHINYVKDDTTLENCITLCRSCHSKTNSNRDYWIKYFSI